MSISTIKRKGVPHRYRFEFKRTVNGRFVHVTKVLPKGITEAQAIEYDGKETARIFAEQSGLTTAASDVPTIARCVLIYLQEGMNDVRDPSLIRRELAIASDTERGGFGNLTLDKVGEWSEDYITHGLQVQKWKPSTIKNRLAYVRAAINFCRTSSKHKIGQREHWASLMKFPKVNNIRTNVIDYTYDIPTLLGACDTAKGIRDPFEMKALLMFCLYTGMRWRSEVLQLTRKSIKGDSIVSPVTKNGKPHAVPLHDALRPYVSAVPFNKMHSREYAKQFEKVFKASGLDVTPHDLRRSFASHLISSGMDAVAVMQAMNQTPGAAWRYQHVSNAAKQRAVHSLPTVAA